MDKKDNRNTMNDFERIQIFEHVEGGHVGDAGVNQNQVRGSLFTSRQGILPRFDDANLVIFFEIIMDKESDCRVVFDDKDTWRLKFCFFLLDEFDQFTHLSVLSVLVRVKTNVTAVGLYTRLSCSMVRGSRMLISVPPMGGWLNLMLPCKSSFTNVWAISSPRFGL